jgi:probable rRNA maturation factor
MSASIAQIDVCDATNRMEPDVVAWLEAQGRVAMQILALKGFATVRVVDDREMAAAHLRFSGVDGTTDVLTFSHGTPENINADVLVCLDEALRQSLPAGYPYQHELLLYIIHAVLHCIGMDDLEEEQALAMHAREDEVLTAMGIGAVYARRRGSAPEDRA